MSELGIPTSQFVNEYLGTLNENERDMATAIAGDLLDQGRPLAPTVVIIPVAAHQEALWIPKAMEQYARQEPLAPFSVVLGLNAPTDKVGSAGEKATIEAVEMTKGRYPELDVRSTHVHYDQPVIGAVRRDLWNGVATASRSTDNLESGTTVIGINHDIDLVRLARRGIACIQDQYRRLDEQQNIISTTERVYGTKMRHAYSPQHPNISRAVMWMDFIFRQADSPYEAGLVIPLGFYAKYGGFRREAAMHEVGGLTSQSIMSRQGLLPGTNTETSPRRYVARMEEYGYDIWSRDFTANDKCREQDNYPDISKARMLTIMEESVRFHGRFLRDAAVASATRDYQLSAAREANMTAHGGEYYTFMGEYIKQRIKKIGCIASYALKRFSESDKVVEKFNRAFDPDQRYL